MHAEIVWQRATDDGDAGSRSKEHDMSHGDATAKPSRCVFCHMPTPDRFLGLFMCPICRDQSYDFLLVSGVQLLMAPIIGISLRQFLGEELSIFVASIFVKHRIVPPWQRGH